MQHKHAGNGCFRRVRNGYVRSMKGWEKVGKDIIDGR